MEPANFRRELIKAANRKPHRLTAREVAAMLDWFENLSGEAFNELLHTGVDFPDGYIKCWRDLGDDDGEEEPRTDNG